MNNWNAMPDPVQGGHYLQEWDYDNTDLSESGQNSYVKTTTWTDTEIGFARATCDFSSVCNRMEIVGIDNYGYDAYFMLSPTDDGNLHLTSPTFSVYEVDVDEFPSSTKYLTRASMLQVSSAFRG